MQLIPYLQSAFRRYANDGTPPFRAPVLDYPDQQNLQFVEDQFLVGDRMLVAPLFAGEASREVTLPPGDWHDFWSGQLFAGGATHSVPSSTEKIPVFVKSGSVIPLAVVGSSTASPQSRQLVVQIYGDGHLSWQLELPASKHIQLSWDPVTKRGRLLQSQEDGEAFEVLDWKVMAE